MGDDAVVRLLEQLPSRFYGDGCFSARIRLAIGEVERDVVIERFDCRVEMPHGSADAEIRTDAATWGAIDAGRISGIEAFTRRSLTVRGSIDKALWFEPCFDRAGGAPPAYSMRRIDVGRVSISALIAGDEEAEPLLLLHGLGATKASWVTVIPQLARRYRVVAVDLPGFGASSKPRVRYDAAWFSEQMFRLLDAMGYERALIAGNSMGGRIAQEMAMTQGARVRAIACLCPATAFWHRPMLVLARLARAELGMLLSMLPRARMKEALREMFCDPTRIEEAWFDAAIDDFLTTWKSPRARLAFFASARNIYLDEPAGDSGFWARLADMRPPALYVFGGRDYLISARFARHVSKALPAANVEVWKDCGHVPQLELPNRTAQRILSFFRAATKQRVGLTAGAVASASIPLR